MKRLAKVSMVLTVMAVLLTGCNCHNRMAQKADDIKVTVTPEVLVVKGGAVTADVKVTFPPKYLKKKSVMSVTPVLVFNGGEIEGTPKFYQGEKVKDNYTVIPLKTGGTYTQTVSFPYDSRADISTLELRVATKCNCDDDKFEPVRSLVVANGVRNPARMAEWNSAYAIMPDNFKRVTTNTFEADLVYLVNSSQVRNVALSSEQIKMFEQFVKDAEKADRTTLGNIYSKGYASPEGPVKFNDELSKSRSESAKSAMNKQLKGVTIDAAAYGEDWDGFKKAVEASNIQDKGLILQVLEMYSSPVQRDEQIKNMSQVYDVLKKDVLPQLRRSQLVANADVMGKTDAEIKAAVNNNVKSLNLEELLYGATLFDDNATVLKTYETAGELYNDPRAFNNYGVTLAKEGNYNEAKKAFEKAASITSAPEISNNLGVNALVQGNFDEAKKYPLLANAKGLYHVAEGDYASATKTLSGYNLAVAEVANGNLSQAKSALGNIATGKADYLRGVIAMREGNADQAISNLKSAFVKEPALKAVAESDVEFAKIKGLF